VPHPTISRIEGRKTAGISFATLDRLAHALDVHPAVLIERRDKEMADTDNIKRQIMRLVADGRAEDASDFAEAVREELSEEESEELHRWIAENAFQGFQPPAGSDAHRAKWLMIAGYIKEGETLREAFPRLPRELQIFLKDEATKSRAKKLH
jgi:transcriptional regulator with XRE-family HTH domain